jgi:small nuclear ribonucleoprotein (snRNP)-like protein
MQESSRPLDTLNKARNETVMVELKNGYSYVGKLRAFDIHINTVLGEAEEYEIKKIKEVKTNEDGSHTESLRSERVLIRKLGTVFIRGDTITIITPA